MTRQSELQQSIQQIQYKQGHKKVTKSSYYSCYYIILATSCTREHLSTYDSIQLNSKHISCNVTTCIEYFKSKKIDDVCPISEKSMIRSNHGQSQKPDETFSEFKQMLDYHRLTEFMKTKIAHTGRMWQQCCISIVQFDDFLVCSFVVYQ